MAAVHLSERQYQLLLGAQREGEAVTTKSPRKRKQDLPENQLEAQLDGYLGIRGWLGIRLLPGVYRTLDGRRCVRGADNGTPDKIWVRGSDYFFVEAKGPQGRLKPSQELWHTRAVALGLPVVTARDLEEFDEWYRRRYDGTAESGYSET